MADNRIPEDNPATPETEISMPDDFHQGGPSDHATQDATDLPPDLIGDIPPPPIPRPPLMGAGIAGIPGTEAGTLAQPGKANAIPFRTSAFKPAQSQRFGPGVPMAGGDPGIGISPDVIAELLRSLATNGGGATL